jgi:hypothetical protein
MKIDPGMHIGLHLVFFGKTGVTSPFDTTINRQQAPFSGAIAGEQVIKIQSSIAFVNIFSFSLDFSFASLNFDHPQNKKINLGFCSSFLLVFVYILFIANPNWRWTATISNKKHIFCGWSRKLLQAKVTCNTKSKIGARTLSKYP